MTKSTTSRPPTEPITVNRKAFHDYFIEEEYEAGIVLSGSEIKSLRGGRVNLRGSYARVDNDEVWLVDAHISAYEQSGTLFNHDPMRARKLLLHRREISRLAGKLNAKGLTLVPLDLHWSGRRAKVKLGVARGKKLYDKRDSIAERDATRELARVVKSRRFDD